MRKPLVSVIVCTYNRAALLASCLEALACQDCDGDVFEVLVVDNNSSDETPRIAGAWTDSDQRFRLLHEAEQGLSHARNRGWREAAGAYVAYIDDDAIAYPDWISEMCAFTTRHPDVCAFGGPYHAFSTAPLPLWLPHDYGSWSLGDMDRPIRKGAEWINGTNMVFKRELLARFHGFRIDLGMSGDTVCYGEETRVILDIQDAGGTVFYAHRMTVRHLVQENKASLSWLLKSAYAVGRCSSLTLNRERSLLSTLVCFVWSMFQAVKPLAAWRSMPLKWRVYLACAGPSRELGALIESFQQNTSDRK